jgi:hypothetical protein
VTPNPEDDSDIEMVPRGVPAEGDVTPNPQDDSDIEMVPAGPFLGNPLVGFGRANEAAPLQVKAEAHLDSPVEAEAQGRVRRGHLLHADHADGAQAALPSGIDPPVDGGRRRARSRQEIRNRLCNPPAPCPVHFDFEGPAPPLLPMVAQGSPEDYCLQGHRLDVCNITPELHARYCTTCDLCSGVVSVGRQAWHCDACDYALCSQCKSGKRRRHS